MIEVLNWCEDIEDSAVKQIQNLKRHPILTKWIAVMPDAHCGYGMPIGAVIAAERAVIPNAVGVDIGCGMRAVKTGFREEDLPEEKLKEVLSGIRKAIPVGMRRHLSEINEKCMPDHPPEFSNSIVEKEWKSASQQLGTLGGGNHFIEIQHDEDGIVWYMIHSGSRNLGYKVANHYNKMSEELNTIWRYRDLVKQELSFIPRGEDLYYRYIEEMEYCIRFAEYNRMYMDEDIKTAFLNAMDSGAFSPAIDISHNYAAMENHAGDNVMIHRKGATRARKGELGIIPGSQGTASYIVEGLGNEQSFCSCSHGAGRKMSRSKARKTLDFLDEKRILDEKGVIHAIRSQADLDEAPSAYKDIDAVMESQKDLVKIVRKLTPMAVIKG